VYPCDPRLILLWLLAAFFLAYAFADFELDFGGLLVGVDDDVIPVKDFAVENFQRQRILQQLLDRALQRTCAGSSGRIPA